MVSQNSALPPLPLCTLSRQAPCCGITTGERATACLRLDREIAAANVLGMALGPGGAALGPNTLKPYSKDPFATEGPQGIPSMPKKML